MGKEAGGEAVGELLKKDGFTASQVEPVCDAIGGGFCNGVRSAEKWAARQIELATQPFYDGLEAVTDELYGAAGVVAEPLCRSQLPKNVCQGLGDAVEWVTDYLFFEGRLERLRGGFTGLIADEIDTAQGIAETTREAGRRLAALLGVPDEVIGFVDDATQPLLSTVKAAYSWVSSLW